MKEVKYGRHRFLSGAAISLGVAGSAIIGLGNTSLQTKKLLDRIIK